jgi:hypothetical protein
MAKAQIGQLAPRYSFILNQHPNERLSRCPQCDRPTHLRKFALLVHIDELGLMAQGKTCRYCTKCELIIAHQDELEAQLTESVGTIALDLVGNKYTVLGTVERKFWQRGMHGSDHQLEEALNHTADFKHVLDLKVRPGGWYLAQ